MHFGLFDRVERRDDVAPAQQYEEGLELICRAEAAGFFGYHLGEHHNAPLSMAGSQAVFLTAVARATKRIRLGTLVYVLPLHNPIRLIEDVCMLDQLSQGRMEIGVGRGVDDALDFRMWGGNPEENTERFEETLAILIEGLQTERLTHRGAFFNYDDLWIEMRSLQKPCPPFWWAGNPAHAGERGMNFVGHGRTIALLANVIQTYKDAYAASSVRLAGRDEPLYGARKTIFLADTDAEAKERAIGAWQAHRSHYWKPLSSGSTGPDLQNGPGRVTYEDALREEALIVGSPDTVREYVTRYAAGSGANYFVGVFQWGNLTYKESSHSLDLFAKEVMPSFDYRAAHLGG